MAFSESTDSDEESYEEEAPISFISWLIQRPGTHWLCEVEVIFIEDKFNLYGLDLIVPHYKQCIEILLGAAPADGMCIHGDLVSEAIDLYGLIHARYILTPKGIPLLADKLRTGTFGLCPRFNCKRQAVLPIGMSENLREYHAMLFCPRCQDIFEISASDRALISTTVQRTRLLRGSASSGNSSSSSSSAGPGPRSSTNSSGSGSWNCLPGLDGAFFGPSAPHVLLLQYPALLLVGAVETEGYIPRIFGFRVHNQRGAVSRSSGDSRGLYATGVTVAPALVKTGAPTRTRSSDDVAASGARASLSKTRQGVLRQSPGEPKRDEAASVEALNVPLPVELISSSDLEAFPGTPAKLAPFVFPVEGMPGGVPVYASPIYEVGKPVNPSGRLSGVAAARQQGSAGSTPVLVVRDGVSYVVMRPNGKPMTSCAVPGGPKDDFSDDDAEETVVPVDAGAGGSGQKRKRKM